MNSRWIKQKLVRFLGCGLSNLVPPKTLSNTLKEKESKMGEGYYGVSDEFIMFVIVPCLIGLVCFVCKLGDGYGDA